MAGSPKYKVYSPDGEYLASCKDACDAAALVSLALGRTVRLRHGSILFRQGSETIDAGESYDAAAELIMHRERAVQEDSYLRTNDKLPEGYTPVERTWEGRK